MKRRDIKKLKDAFDIPEPERKAEFTRIHGEKFSKKKTAVSENPIFRYAPALALAAILIGLWGFIKPDGSLRENPGKNNVVVESTDEIPAIVTTSAAQQTSSASSVVQTDKKPIPDLHVRFSLFLQAVKYSLQYVLLPVKLPMQ